jgi:hypothetical protein
MLTFISNPMRILLLLGFTLIFSVATTHAQTPQHPNHRSTVKPHQEKLKVKLYLTVNYIGVGYGLLVEYKLTEKVGLQSGLGVSLQAYPLWTPTANKGSLLGYAGIPLTLRYYVGETKQFCWFGGLNSSYCILAWPKPEGSNPADIGNRYQISINVGFDYETKLGFIGGINLCEQDLLYLPGKPARLNYPRILVFTVGYNFVRLFHILWKPGN